MRGHLHKDARTGSWWIVTSHVDPVTGKRKRKWDGPHRLKKEAEKKRVEILSAQDQGNFVEPSKITVAAYFRDMWLPTKRDEVRPSTFRGYQSYVDRHIAPQLGAIRLQRLAAVDLNNFYSQLSEHMAPATVRRIHVVLRQGLADAMLWNLIQRNPATLVRPPRASGSKTMKTWSAEELEAFLHSVKDDRLFALWRLFAVTGARRSEVLALRHSDIDLDRGSMTINQGLVIDGSNLIFCAPKTTAGGRTIDLDAITVAALKGHRARQIEERLALGAAYRSDLDLVFADGDGGPIHPNYISTKFNIRVRRAHLRRVRLHDLRHTWASLALKAQVHPRVVQERLGHSSIAVTLGIYSHLAPGMGKAAGDMVAALVDGNSR